MCQLCSRRKAFLQKPQYAEPILRDRGAYPRHGVITRRLSSDLMEVRLVLLHLGSYNEVSTLYLSRGNIMAENDGLVRV